MRYFVMLSFSVQDTLIKDVHWAKVKIYVPNRQVSYDTGWTARNVIKASV